MMADNAQQYCTALTKRSGSNFYYSFLFLPKVRREAMYAVYAFCREVDSVVDEPSPGSDPREVLARRRAELATMYQPGTSGDGNFSPVIACLAAHVRRFDIPQSYFEDVIAGVEMDLSVDRYRTFDELSTYCYRVASSVGLICLRIFGALKAESEAYAINLGLAFQLTNILRDVKSDGHRGRIYLPLEDLARFQVTEHEILNQVDSVRFRGLMAFECRRAREFYGRAEAALTATERPVLLPAEIMRAIYQTILERIEARHYQVFGERITIAPWHRLAKAVQVWLATRSVRHVAL
jgi:15-cis-phytoene synthase